MEVAPNVYQPVRRVVDREAVVVGPDDTLRDAAEQLFLNAIGTVVVAEDGWPIALVCEGDVIAAIARGFDLATTPVRQVMSRRLMCARLDEPVYEVAMRMVDEDIRHLPLLDGEGQLAGVISSRDLLRPLLLSALDV
jgi:CBS domain-containing protein